MYKLQYLPAIRGLWRSTKRKALVKRTRSGIFAVPYLYADEITSRAAERDTLAAGVLMLMRWLWCGAAVRLADESS